MVTEKTLIKRHRTKRLRKRHGDRCYYCDQMMHFDHDRPFDELRGTIEHIIRQADGGSDRMDNLVLACHACNTGRMNKTPEQWRVIRRGYR